MDPPTAAPVAEAAAQQGLVFAHRVGLLGFSVLLLVLILELVRRGHLKERYALLWLLTAVAGLAIGIFPGIITGLSRALSFQYLALLFVVSFLFLLGIVLSFTVVISRLSEHNRELTQEVALLENALRRLEKKLEE